MEAEEKRVKGYTQRKWESEHNWWSFRKNPPPSLDLPCFCHDSPLLPPRIPPFPSCFLIFFPYGGEKSLCIQLNSIIHLDFRKGKRKTCPFFPLNKAKSGLPHTFFSHGDMRIISALFFSRATFVRWRIMCVGGGLFSLLPSNPLPSLSSQPPSFSPHDFFLSFSLSHHQFHKFLWWQVNPAVWKFSSFLPLSPSLR